MFNRVLGITMRCPTQCVHTSLTPIAPVFTFPLISTPAHDFASLLAIPRKKCVNSLALPLSLILLIQMDKFCQHTLQTLLKSVWWHTPSCWWDIPYPHLSVDYCGGFSSGIPLVRTASSLINLCLVVNFQNANLLMLLFPLEFCNGFPLPIR